VVFNELAPRTHNSGHVTMDACITSQFAQVVRAACGFPLGSTELRIPGSSWKMTNIFGENVADAQKYLGQENCFLHLYGKAANPSKPRRKCGHVNERLS